MPSGEPVERVLQERNPCSAGPRELLAHSRNPADNDVSSGAVPGLPSGAARALLFPFGMGVARFAGKNFVQLPVRSWRLPSMAPIITIIVIAIIGFLIYGIVGLIVGAVAGWLLSMLIGTIAMAWSGWASPEESSKTSGDLLLYEPSTNGRCAYGRHGEAGQASNDRGLMERIFRRATLGAPLVAKSMGMSQLEVEEAADQEAADEQNPRVRELILLLKNYILQTMY